jgi:hypothetical protein
MFDEIASTWAIVSHPAGCVSRMITLSTGIIPFSQNSF